MPFPWLAGFLPLTDGKFVIYLSKIGTYMNVSFKAVAPYRKKDGTYPVYIRVTFRGKYRRISTTLAARPSDLTRGGKIKSADILGKAGELIARMRDALADVSFFDYEDKDVDWIVGRIRTGMAGELFRLDFFRFADKYLEGKSEGSRPAYRQALNALERYLGRRQLDVNEITRSMLLDFMETIDKEPRMQYNGTTGEWRETKVGKIPRAASSRHIMKLGHIFQAARLRYNDEDGGVINIPRSPFSGIKQVHPQGTGQRNLGTDLMQRIISSRSDDRVTDEALAVFVLSFLLMGANLADFYEAVPVEGELWRYQRKKTRTRRPDGAEIIARVPAEAGPYLERLQDGPSGWWLPALHRYRGADAATAMVNRGLRKWCEAEGVPVFTFYAARHSFASIARGIGVEKATIDDALGHRGQWDLTDIYAERSWGLVEEATRRVLDLFQF